jgi:DNA-binding transcriptional MocR family regulator
VPDGGLALWCELPEALGTATTVEAERRGVVVAPGPVFAVEGGLDRFVRIPWTAEPERLVQAVRRLAEAWQDVSDAGEQGPSRPSRVLVA